MTQQKAKKKSKILWIIIFLLLLLIGVGAGIYFQMTKDNSLSRLTRDELALGGLLPGKTDQEVADLLSAKVAEGMVDIGIAAAPVFEYGGKKGRIAIENIAANHYSFQVDISLEDTGDVVYQSGLIDPGFYIEYIGLNKALQPGDYQATARFTTYSLDETEDRISEANVKLVLHVMDGAFYQ